MSPSDTFGFLPDVLPLVQNSPLAFVATVLAMTLWFVLRIRSSRSHPGQVDRPDGSEDGEESVTTANGETRRHEGGDDIRLRRFNGNTQYMFYSVAVVFAGATVLSALWIFLAGSQPVLMSRVFEEEESRASALEWLRRRQGLFHFDDPTLADTLAAIVPSRIRAESGSALMEEARRTNELIDRHPALKELRDRALSQKPPFHPVAMPIRVGLPEDAAHHPRPCTMSVVRGGPLERRRILLKNHQNTRELILYGKGGITDPAASVDVHLNGDQVQYLFGQIAGGTTVEGYVVILPGEGTLKEIRGKTCPGSEQV
jgi:hypothetical protein